MTGQQWGKSTVGPEKKCITLAWRNTWNITCRLLVPWDVALYIPTCRGLLGLQFPILGRNRRNNHFWSCEQRIKQARFHFCRGQSIQWFPKQKWSHSSCSLSHEKKRGEGAPGELWAACLRALVYVTSASYLTAAENSEKAFSTVIPRLMICWQSFFSLFSQ